MMIYFSDKEALAVEQISLRINELPYREWNDWSADEVLDPPRKMFIHSNSEIDLRNPFSSFGKIKRLDDMDRWNSYQDLLRSFPRFIHMNQQYSDAAEGEADWVDAITSAAKTRNMAVESGTAHLNEFKGARVAVPLTVLKLTDKTSGIYAELADNKQLAEDDGYSKCKLLYVHNPSRVNPYRTKVFMAELRQTLMDECKYDIVYSHVSEMDQPDHPHNAKVCKRFKMNHAFDVVQDNWAHTYYVSNLCHYWGLIGRFKITPSPEDPADVCVCYMSKRFKKNQVKRAPEAWRYIDEYNGQRRKR